jgi:hypothetical protein
VVETWFPAPPSSGELGPSPRRSSLTRIGWDVAGGSAVDLRLIAGSCLLVGGNRIPIPGAPSAATPSDLVGLTFVDRTYSNTGGVALYPNCVFCVDDSLV